MSIVKSDAFGQKVVYYNATARNKHFTNLPEFVRRNGHNGFDPAGITSFMTFRYPIGDHTMFKDYKKVPFGTKIENDTLKTYWYPQFQNNRISFNEAIEKVETLLKVAIKRLVTGKKTGVPLSGGVDSSLIVALIKKLFPNKSIYTYIAGFYGDDEFEYARIVSKQFGTIHKEIILSANDYIGKNSLLRPLIRAKAAPLHPNEIALAEVENLAKNDGCELAICGEGADDIFGGYGQNLKMYMNCPAYQSIYKFFLKNYRYFSNEERAKIINDNYNIDDFEILSCSLTENEIPNDIRNKIFYFIQKVHTPGLIIRGANAMRFNGLECGFPYLDMELVNYVNSLPFDYKVHWKSEQHRKLAINMSYKEISEKMDVPKYILKKIAEKYLPKKIIYRPKYGFPVPFEKWFDDLEEWPLDSNVFKSTDISNFSGWKKFMLINLDSFVKEFAKYSREHRNLMVEL